MSETKKTDPNKKVAELRNFNPWAFSAHLSETVTEHIVLDTKMNPITEEWEEIKKPVKKDIITETVYIPGVDEKKDGAYNSVQLTQRQLDSLMEQPTFRQLVVKGGTRNGIHLERISDLPSLMEG